MRGVVSSWNGGLVGGEHPGQFGYHPYPSLVDDVHRHALLGHPGRTGYLVGFRADVTFQCGQAAGLSAPIGERWCQRPSWIGAGWIGAGGAVSAISWSTRASSSETQDARSRASHSRTWVLSPTARASRMASGV